MLPSILTLTSTRTVDRLGEKDAALLQEVASRAAQRASEEIASDEEELVAWFRGKGITVSEVDRPAFRKAVETHFESRDYPFDASYLPRLRELATP